MFSLNYENIRLSVHSGHFPIPHDLLTATKILCMLLTFASMAVSQWATTEDAWVRLFSVPATISFAAGGSFCLHNAAVCGWTHCHVTGRLFLLCALVALLHGTRVIPFFSHTDVVLGAGWIVGFALSFVLHCAFGKYGGHCCKVD